MQINGVEINENTEQFLRACLRGDEKLEDQNISRDLLTKIQSINFGTVQDVHFTFAQDLPIDSQKVNYMQRLDSVCRFLTVVNKSENTTITVRLGLLTHLHDKLELLFKAKGVRTNVEDFLKEEELSKNEEFKPIIEQLDGIRKLIFSLEMPYLELSSELKR